MVIGIDSSRAFVSDKTGTEYYSYHLVTEMLRLPESKLHTFVLFTRLNAILPKELALYSNVIIKPIKFPYLWTQVGLAWETWFGIQLDVLWIPAHTLPVLRSSRIRTVVTIHGLEYQWLKEYKNVLQKWYLPLSTFYAAKNADKLIAVSEFTAKQLIEQLHTTPKKIKVIHEGTLSSSNPVIQFSGKTMEKYGLEWKKYILFVGSVQPRKNLVSLITAFAEYAKEEPDQKLVIAGGIGWMAEETLRAPSRLGIQERVVFTGRVSDLEIKQLYAGAVMYVQPSITEGFGLPVLEAMANGVPVISSDGGALSEVVGEAGIIVKITNQKFSNSQINDQFAVSLAKAMKRLSDDKKLQNNLISMGRERVKEFGWDKAAKATLEILVGEGYKY